MAMWTNPLTWDNSVTLTIWPLPIGRDASSGDHMRPTRTWTPHRATPWLASGLRVLVTVAAAVPVAIWIPDFQTESKLHGSIDGLRALGWENLWLLAAIAAPVLFEIARSYTESRRARLERARNEAFRDRAVATVSTVLQTSVSLIEQVLRVTANVRVFDARSDTRGLVRLHQSNRFHMEHTPLPTEMGFGSMSVNEPGMITAEAFRERRPIYRDLPDDHMTWYSENVALHVDPEQKWVLACPILRMDLATGMQDPVEEPRGVLVFYGTTRPAETKARDAHITAALAHARDVSGALGHIFDSETLIARPV